MCDMTLSYVWQDSFMCDMTHSCVSHDSFICVTWLIHMIELTHSYVWHDSFIRVTWLMHMCDMTHSYVWHDSFICVTWLTLTIRQGPRWFIVVLYVTHLQLTCAMTHSYVPHDSFIRVPWLIYMCDMTLAYVWHGFILTIWRDPPWLIVELHVTHLQLTCAMTHSYDWIDSFICVTWLIHMCDTTLFLRSDRAHVGWL